MRYGLVILQNSLKKLTKFLITAVIPTHNRKLYLQQLLEDINIQRVSSDKFNLNAVVVVDGSNDGTNGMLKKYDFITTVTGNGNWWFTKSLNEGCRVAIENFNPDFILTLNDDVRLSHNYILNLIKDKINIPINKRITGSISLNLIDKQSITFSGVIKRKLLGSYNNYYSYGTKFNGEKHNGLLPTLILPTRGTLIPTEIFKRLSGFDNSFPQYGSDTDFSLRARKIKVPIYISYDAIIYENIATTGKASPRLNNTFSYFLKNFLFNEYSPTYIRKNLRMIWRHQPKVLFPLFSLIMILGTIKSYYKY